MRLIACGSDRTIERDRKEECCLTEEELRREIAALVEKQFLAVLATGEKGRPYASLVGFLASPDLRQVVFCTPRTTRKFANLISSPEVALLIDSRTNKPADFRKARAVTAMGRAQELDKAANPDLVRAYLDRFPHLGSFVASPTCALIGVEVHTYFLVSRFQHVMELHLEE
jgi:uncharacterized pyridoxamine 5'-phosphate oxidase family protein